MDWMKKEKMGISPADWQKLMAALKEALPLPYYLTVQKILYKLATIYI